MANAAKGTLLGAALPFSLLGCVDEHGNRRTPATGEAIAIALAAADALVASARLAQKRDEEARRRCQRFIRDCLNRGASACACAVT